MGKNFVPLFIHRHKIFKELIRIDDQEQPKDGYETEKMFYVIDRFSTYTKLNGTCNLYILNYEQPPYNTLNISYNDNLVFPNKKKHPFSTFIFASYTFQVENSKSLYIENGFYKNYKNIVLHYRNINQHVPIYEKKYLFRITVFTKPYLFWKCLPNCICVPTDDENEYDTKMGCMYNCFNHNYNQNNYVNDSSKLLHDILH